MDQAEQDECALLAKTLTAMCVRNTEIEDIHAGRSPATKTGDFTDIKVIDAEGHEFSWAEASRISDDEMKMLIKGVVNRIYAALMQLDDPEFAKYLHYHSQFTHKWDDPEIHPTLDCGTLKETCGDTRQVDDR